MEQFKNILLGFLIAIVVCLAYQNYNLKNTPQQSAVSNQEQMFDNFLNLVKELKKIEQENK